MTKRNNYNVRLPAALETRFVGEAPPSVITNHLRDYAALLDLSTPLEQFSRAELMLIADATNGIIMEPHTAYLLWAEIDDAIRLDGLDHKWSVDGPQIVAKLRALSRFECWALNECIQQWWRNPSEERWQALGLPA